MEVQKVFQGYFKKGSTMLQERLKGVLRESLVGFKGI